MLQPLTYFRHFVKSFNSLEGLRFFLITKACDSTEKTFFTSCKILFQEQSPDLFLSPTILMTSYNSPGHQTTFLRMKIIAHYGMFKVSLEGGKKFLDQLVYKRRLGT